jgi:putative tryptophan/tyrosine transport system substrate-binding protein
MDAVKAGPDVIITGGGFFTRICQRATRTIPIVTMSDDLVREKLVESFARPEGNTTGTSILAEDLDRKRQELLMEVLPDARHLTVVIVGRPRRRGDRVGDAATL